MPNVAINFDLFVSTLPPSTLLRLPHIPPPPPQPLSKFDVYFDKITGRRSVFNVKKVLVPLFISVLNKKSDHGKTKKFVSGLILLTLLYAHNPTWAPSKFATGLQQSSLYCQYNCVNPVHYVKI